ncbi:hypothetical protein HZC31_02095 [Candidatus Woesearchaeota archaeon]|nr:hypothetical protein [Candidatus Woesearchaeota archaeon]
MDDEKLTKRGRIATVILAPLYALSIYYVAEKNGYFEQGDGTNKEETIIPASEATLHNLKKKCDGNSYTIVVEDHPGRAEFMYDAEKNTYGVSLGLSAAGVNECEKYEDHKCVAYKADFAPSKWTYTDIGVDGLVDLVLSYRQNRDGTEELMATQKPTVEQEVYTRQLQFFEGIQPNTNASTVKVAPCSQ